MCDSAMKDVPETAMVAALEESVHRIGVVVPVYQGARTLGPLLAMIADLTEPVSTPGGESFRIAEVILVHDGGTDGSDAIIETLASIHPFIVPIWLSRNFGQHAAVMAGIAASSSPWVATLDEDGMHDPGDLGRLLDAGVTSGARLVYGIPEGTPPHGLLRNAASRMVKWAFRLLAETGDIQEFHSFRLIDGEVARGVAAFGGSGIFLDVALSWVVDFASNCTVPYHASNERPTGYDLRRLTAHGARMALSTGTRPLRFITLLGGLTLVLALLVTLVVAWQTSLFQVPVAAWIPGVLVSTCLGGAIMVSLGVIGEFLGHGLLVLLGKPLYLEVSGPGRKKRA